MLLFQLSTPDAKSSDESDGHVAVDPEVMAICSLFVANMPKHFFIAMHPSHELEEAVIFTLPIAQFQCFCHDCFFTTFSQALKRFLQRVTLKQRQN